MNHSDVCVVLPCYNEGITIGQVVRDFAAALPSARIVVFDNASTDDTAEQARDAGAEIVYSPLRGKGNVIRHMSQTIDADIIVLADGDGTYDASAAPALIQRFRELNLDMLVATRLEQHSSRAFRAFHRFGNRLVSGLVSSLSGSRVTDILSGYRVLSRELVKLVRLRATGFEVETELTLQALAKRFSIGEYPVAYRARPQGSVSKLNTWGDGFVILKSFFLLFKDYRPLPFFITIALLFALVSLIAGSGPILEYYRTGLVYQTPRAILAAGLGILAVVSFGIGLILDTVSKYHEENIELWRQQIQDLRRISERIDDKD